MTTVNSSARAVEQVNTQTPVAEVNATVTKVEKKFETLTGTLISKGKEWSTTRKVLTVVALIIPALIGDFFQGIGRVLSKGVAKLSGPAKKAAEKVKNLFVAKELTPQEVQQKLIRELRNKMKSYAKELVDLYRVLDAEENLSTKKARKADDKIRLVQGALLNTVKNLMIARSTTCDGLIKSRTKITELLERDIADEAKDANYRVYKQQDTEPNPTLKDHVIGRLLGFNNLEHTLAIADRFVELAKNEPDVVSALKKGVDAGILTEKRAEKQFAKMAKKGELSAFDLNKGVEKGLITAKSANKLIDKSITALTNQKDLVAAALKESVDLGVMTDKEAEAKLVENAKNGADVVAGLKAGVDAGVVTFDAAKQVIAEHAQTLFDKNLKDGFSQADEAMDSFLDTAQNIGIIDEKGVDEVCAGLKVNIPELAKAVANDIAKREFNDDEILANELVDHVNNLVERDFIKEEERSSFTTEFNAALPEAKANVKAKQEAAQKAKAEAEENALKQAQANEEIAQKAKAEADAKVLMEAKIKEEAALKIKAEEEANALKQAQAEKEAEATRAAEAAKAAEQASLYNKFIGLLSSISTLQFKQKDLFDARAVIERDVVGLTNELKALKEKTVVMVIKGDEIKKPLLDAAKYYLEECVRIAGSSKKYTDKKQLEMLNKLVNNDEGTIKLIEEANNKNRLLTEKMLEKGKIADQITENHSEINRQLAVYEVFKKSSQKLLTKQNIRHIKIDEVTVNSRQEKLEGQYSGFSKKGTLTKLNIFSSESKPVVRVDKDGNLEDVSAILDANEKMPELETVVVEPDFKAAQNPLAPQKPVNRLSFLWNGFAAVKEAANEASELYRYYRS